MKRKEIMEGKVRTNEYIYTLNKPKKDELMDVIQLVLNQYIKYQKPSFDIYDAGDRKQCVGYMKYCITFIENSENEVYPRLVETLTHTLLDYFINQDYEDENEYKYTLYKSCRRHYRNSESVTREYFK